MIRKAINQKRKKKYQIARLIDDKCSNNNNGIDWHREIHHRHNNYARVGNVVVGKYNLTLSDASAALTEVC